MMTPERPMHRALCAIALSIVLLLFCIPAFPEDGEKEERCPTCRSTGKIADKKCPEKRPYISTFDYTEYPSHGWGFLVCPDCFGAQAEWDALETAYRKWLEARREKIDIWVFGNDYLKYGIQHVEGDHFIVCGTFRGGTDWDGRTTKKMTAKERAENYIRMTEGIYRDHFLKHVDMPDYTPSEKWELTIWNGGRQIDIASNRLIGITQGGISTFQGKLLTIADSSGSSHYQSIIFNLFYVIIQEFEGNVARALPDWLSEGYAHYIEVCAFGQVANNFSDEAAGGGSLSGGNFEPKLKQMVKSGKYPDIVKFGNWNVSKLGYAEKMVAWGLIDWIIKGYGPKKFRLFIQVLKRTKDQAQAFRDAIGVRYSDIHKEWGEWVLANY